MSEVKKSHNSILPSSKISFLMMVLVIVLGCLVAYLGFYLYEVTKKVQLLEVTALNNDRQIGSFNQILGRSIDPNQADVMMNSPVEFKASIEAFQQLTRLLSEVHLLSANPLEPQAKKSLIQPVATSKEGQAKGSGNAEMRWWGQMLQHVWVPLKDFFQQVVMIQVMDTSIDQLAMTGDEQHILRSELKIRLLAARQLLLNGLVRDTQRELVEIRRVVVNHFAVQQPSVKQFISSLDEIKNNLDKLPEALSPDLNLPKEKK